MTLPATQCLPASALGAAVGFGLLFVIAWFYRRARGSEGMGGVDLKLAAGSGAMVGVETLLVGVLLGSLIGVLSYLIALASGRLTASHEVPFGPCMAAGVLIGFVPSSH